MSAVHLPNGDSLGKILDAHFQRSSGDWAARWGVAKASSHKQRGTAQVPAARPAGAPRPLSRPETAATSSQSISQADKSWHVRLLFARAVATYIRERVAANVSWRTTPSLHRAVPPDFGGYEFSNPPCCRSGRLATVQVGQTPGPMPPGLCFLACGAFHSRICWSASNRARSFW
jgi:hypothetical protein